MDAGARRRPALRPRRRRRRVRRVRLARSPSRRRRRAGLPHARCVVLDRGQRGERQPRPAGPPRRAGRPHRPAGARRVPRLGLRSTTSGCGSPRRCAAWSAASLHRRRCSTRACTPATPAASCRRASASSASCSTASRTPTTGRVLLDALHVDMPDRPARRGPAHGGRADPIRSPSDFPFAGSTGPMVDDPVEQLLARTWRPTRQLRRRRRVAADRPGRQRAAPVRRRCRSASACRRRATRTRPRPALAEALTHDPPSGATVTYRGSAAAPGWNAPAVRAVAARRRSTTRRTPRSASRRARSARAARSRSWACSARSSPTPSS